MAGEPQGNEVTLALEADVQHFAPMAAEVTLAFKASIIPFGPFGQDITLVATRAPIPDPPSFAVGGITGQQISSTGGKGKTRVSLDWDTVADVNTWDLYRIPGNYPLAEGSDYATVTGHGSVVTVAEDIAAGTTSHTEDLTESENGEVWTYYLFANGDGGRSTSQAVMVETIPSIPLNAARTTGDGKVVLSWDQPSDANADGVNIFRSDGTSFNPAIARKLNTALVTTGTFDDSADNVTNRVPEGNTPFPQNGQDYTYKIETEDTVTGWTTGTRNQSDGVSEVTTAVKSDA